MIGASRIVLGLIFVTFGINGFYPLIAVPEFHPFMAILVTSGYIYVIKVVEVAAGLLLLSDRFVPLGLILLGPDIANILVYHALLDHRNWPIAVLNLTLFFILMWGYREYFVPCALWNGPIAPSVTVEIPVDDGQRRVDEIHGFLALAGDPNVRELEPDHVAPTPNRPAAVGSVGDRPRPLAAGGLARSRVPRRA
jgi:putative oxidoreductase